MGTDYYFYCLFLGLPGGRGLNLRERDSPLRNTKSSLPRGLPVLVFFLTIAISSEGILSLSHSRQSATASKPAARKFHYTPAVALNKTYNHNPWIRDCGFPHCVT